MEVQGFLFSPPKPASAFADPASLHFGPTARAATTAQAAKLVAIEDHRKRA
jgi:hypothetical protein